MATPNYSPNIIKKQTTDYVTCPNPACGQQVPQLTSYGYCLRCTATGVKAKGKMHKVKCANEDCEKLFNPSSASQKYCSSYCAEIAYKSGYYLLFHRDNFRCIYCGRSPIEDRVKLHLDHIIPFSKGGKTIAGNLVTACEDCNAHKHAKMLSRETLNRLNSVIDERNKKIGIPNNKPIQMSERYIH